MAIPLNEWDKTITEEWNLKKITLWKKLLWKKITRQILLCKYNNVILTTATQIKKTIKKL